MKIAVNTKAHVLTVEQNGIPVGTTVYRVFAWSIVPEQTEGMLAGSGDTTFVISSDHIFTIAGAANGFADFVTVPFNYFYTEALGSSQLYYLQAANRTDTGEAISLVGHTAITENDAAVPLALVRATRFEIFDGL